MNRVILYEDNRELAESIALFLGIDQGTELVAVFESPQDVLSHIEKFQPDIILMDIHMPGMSGIEAARLIRKAECDVLILMLTVFEDDQHIIDAICAGANGYILKRELANLNQILKDAAMGGAPMTGSIAVRVLKLFAEGRQHKPSNVDGLTVREKEVLNLLTKGYSYKMIASELFLSIDTIRIHIKKIYQKMGVNSATEAISKVYIR